MYVCRHGASTTVVIGFKKSEIMTQGKEKGRKTEEKIKSPRRREEERNGAKLKEPKHKKRKRSRRKGREREREKETEQN